VERRDAIVTGGVAGLVVLAAATAVAANVGALGLGTDPAGTLGDRVDEAALTTVTGTAEDQAPTDLQTIVVDVYAPPGATGRDAPGATGQAPATGAAGGAWDDDEGDDGTSAERDEHEGDDHEEHEEHEHEYEGWDEDD
jgi:hypothetical protein